MPEIKLYVDGKLVEELHVRASRRLLAVAEACS